jgi:hypothetical protein
MPISSESIPNKPLTGAEVLTYSLALVRECAQKYYAKLTKIEFAYTMRNPAVPKHEVSIAHLQEDTIKCPSCEGDDTKECETCCLERRIPNTPAVALNTILAEAKLRMERDWVFGRNLAYPKIGYSFTLHFQTANGSIAKRTISGTVENPNLVRVHYKMPFRSTEKVLPTEENPMGGLIQHEQTFDAAQYPPPAAPVETDVTDGVILMTVEESEPAAVDLDDEDEDDDSEELGSEIAEHARSVDPAMPPASEPEAETAEPAFTPKQRGRKAKQ